MIVNNATISERSPRYKEWLEVFGAPSVRVTAPLPIKAMIEGKGEAEIYLIDLTALGPDQFARLVQFISKKFGMPKAEVLADFGEKGCPILAEDVVVPIDMRFIL